MGLLDDLKKAKIQRHAYVRLELYAGVDKSIRMFNPDSGGRTSERRVGEDDLKLIEKALNQCDRYNGKIYYNGRTELGKAIQKIVLRYLDTQISGLAADARQEAEDCLALIETDDGSVAEEGQ